MIGLEIDLRKMLNSGKVITITALCQIAGSILFGWLFFALLGPAQTRLEAFYLAVAAAMSSTVIIVKILYDKHELETLTGRITLGVLVLQDLATILFLAVQPNLKSPALSVFALAFGKVLLLVAVAYCVARFLLPPIFKFIARLEHEAAAPASRAELAAKIAVYSKRLSKVPALHAACANHVGAPPASGSGRAVARAGCREKELPDQRRSEQARQLGGRREVMP